MNKRVIVSFASQGRENYLKAMFGLIRSAKNQNWDGDFVMSTLDGICDEYLGVKIKNGSWPRNNIFGQCWQHVDAPYRFKPQAILQAAEMGYTEIMWCDSTVRLIDDPNPLFDLAKTQGVVAFDNLGHPLEHYINDTALRNLHTTVEEAKRIQQIMACCIVFNLDGFIGETVFNQWCKASMDGSFDNDATDRPGFITHKSDQAVLSVILHDYGVPINDYGDGFAYSSNMTAGVTDKPIYLVNHGIEPI